MLIVTIFVLLVLSTSSVLSIPVAKVKVSGLVLYQDLGAYHQLLHWGLGNGISVYHDLYGRGYYGLLPVGKYKGGLKLLSHLGGAKAYHTKFGSLGLHSFGKLSGFGSIAYGEPGPKYGLLTGKYGPLTANSLGAIFGGLGVPYGGFGLGNLRALDYGVPKKGVAHNLLGLYSYY